LYHCPLQFTWKHEHRLLALEFEDDFFVNGRGVTKEFKQTHKSPKLTVYDPSTASYIRSDKKVGDPVPAGGTIGWAFWDPRLSGWRVKKDDLIESNTGPLFFGKDKSAFNLRTFSITVSMSKGDVPSSYISFAREWADKVSVKFGVGVERGSKEPALANDGHYTSGIGRWHR